MNTAGIGSKEILIMKIRVQYTTLIVKNLEQSVRFYRDVLGFTEGYHVNLPVGQISIMQSQDSCSGSPDCF